MPRITLPALMFRTPRKFVEDREDGFRPVGTISYQHSISIEGEGWKAYADTDLTEGLNGSRTKLDTGEPVPVEAVVDLYVNSRGKLVPALVALTEPTTKR